MLLHMSLRMHAVQHFEAAFLDDRACGLKAVVHHVFIRQMLVRHEPELTTRAQAGGGDGDEFDAQERIGIAPIMEGADS
jgi:hypothetical protein